MVQVAVGQFAPGLDKADNSARVRSLVDEAAGRGADVVVLPEYASFTAPRMDERFAAAAEPLDGPFAATLSELASGHGVHVVAGFAEHADAGRIHNTLLAFGPSGEIEATYRKMHLYDAFGYRESDVVLPGPLDTPETFTSGAITFGLQTCYDVRFPEVTRRIVDAGATALALPAEWVPGPLKEDHWRTLVRARAIENTMYIAAAGQNGRHGAGNSMIIDPMGVTLASLGEQDGTALALLDPARLESVRRTNPALTLRRFTTTPR
ncbi:carbon-nitrogen hydrolase family protein [Actinomadura flavalba]|uniref:carbon-nitrogen hydrolase family protein n=1 Tax=Actinomadura flavalba TaxID=1120938 RepID=UPI000362C0BA|nr:carbon-nitrogen hydrolase family protein [Actinomadura flavalba]